MASHAA
jgi:hypothetical protein